MAKKILDDIDIIKDYSVTEMKNFISYFQINLAIRAISDGNWTKQRIIDTKKKEFNNHMGKYQIPIGIASKLLQKLKQSIQSTQSKQSKQVLFEEEEEKYEEMRNIHDKDKNVKFKETTTQSPSSNNFYNFRDWKIDDQELKYPTYIAKAVKCARIKNKV